MTSEENVVTSPYQIDAGYAKTFPQHILEHATRHGSRPALIDELTGKTYTYDQLFPVINNCAASLWRLGFRKSDRICILTSNCSEFVIAYFAAMSLGGIVVPLNPLYTVYELEHYMKDVVPIFILTASEVLSKVIQVSRCCKRLKDIIVIDNGQSGHTTFQSLLNDIRTTSGEKFQAPRVEINPKQDPAAICYSSGTTGPPKGCVHTHHNYVTNSLQFTHPEVNFLQDGRDVVIATIPFFHVYGQISFFCHSLAGGATIIILPRFTIDTFLQTITKHKATVLMMVPPAVVQIVSSPLSNNLDLSSVRHVVSGAAPLNDRLMADLRTKMPQCTLLDSYGMTEILACLLNFTAHNRYDSLCCTGKLLPSIQGKVVDLITGRNLGPNQEGEVCFRTPCRMIDYWKGSTLAGNSEQALREDGWFQTGDIGHYDSDGHFYIKERLKETLKYNGFQVSPAELETMILQHPGVQEVAVVGKRHQVAGDLPAAFVVAKTDKENLLKHTVTAQEIIDFMTDKLSPQKKLRGGVYFVPEIPKSASGKILRRTLCDWLNQTKDVQHSATAAADVQHSATSARNVQPTATTARDVQHSATTALSINELRYTPERRDIGFSKL